MEKRFLLFLILSFVFMTGYIALQSALAPPPPPADQVADGDAAADPAPQADPALGPVGQDGQVVDLPLVPEGQTPPGTERPPQPPLAGDPFAETPTPEDQIRALEPQRWTTLQNADSPLRVTFTNQGAGVVFIELVEKTSKGQLRYRAMDDNRVYLGGLILEDAIGGGAVVLYVPPGSPAADADLQAGDVITMVDDHPVVLESDFQQRLTRYRAGDLIQLTLKRDVQETPREIVLPIRSQQRPFALIEPERDGEFRLLNNPASFRMDLALRITADVAKADHDAVMAGVLHDTWQMRVEQGQEPTIEFVYSLTAQQLQPLGLGGPLEVVKRFRIVDGESSKSPSYHLAWDVEFRNGSGSKIDLNYALWGANGLSTEGWWYQNKLHPRMFAIAGARDIVTGYAQGFRLLSAREIHAQANKRPEAPQSVLFASTEPADERSRRYLAGDTQYFAVALLPANIGAGEMLRFGSAEALLIGGPIVDRYRIKLENTTFRAVSESRAIAAGAQLVESYALFCGPKRDDLLESYGISDLIYRGWFASVSQLASAILHALYLVVRNYGLAIILLTVLVKGLMFPLGRKAAMNAQKMQELAPEMKRINEKHKGDMQKRGEEMTALYKRHNFNPMSGCGLMFIQLPVFLSLYRCLAVDIELRQAAFIPGIDWCSNLAGPDKLWNWSEYLPAFLADEGAGYLGPYLNVLPIVTVVLFLVHQQLFMPPPTDDQSRAQQQIMKYMMIFMGVMFFKVPAGLCIYFIASSIWGIGERKLLPKPAAAATTTAATPQEVKKEKEVHRTVEAKKARLKANRRR